METNIIAGNETVNESVLLDEANESLNVFGKLDVSGEDSAVLATGNQNRIDIDKSGTVRGENKAIEVDGAVDASIVNEGTIDGGNDWVDFANGSGVSPATLDQGISKALLNKGLITSDSRAINIGGNLLSVVNIVNEGLVTTTNDPLDGTIY